MYVCTYVCMYVCQSCMSYMLVRGSTTFSARFFGYTSLVVLWLFVCYFTVICLLFYSYFLLFYSDCFVILQLFVCYFTVISFVILQLFFVILQLCFCYFTVCFFILQFFHVIILQFFCYVTVICSDKNRVITKN